MVSSATALNTLDPIFDVVTFDCYGTLINWNAGLGDALDESFPADGRQIDRGVLLAA